MNKLIIHTTTMGYRIPLVQNSSFITGTNISLQDFYAPFIETEYNQHLQKITIVNRYRYYDGKYLYMPLYDLPRLLTFLKDKIEVEIKEIPCNPYVSVDIPLKPQFSPRSAEQASAVEYLVNSTNHIRSLALPTGKGKTASVLLAANRIKRRMLVSMTSLIEQWMESILRFTLLKETDIYIIQGRASVHKLISSIDKTCFPKIILANIPTLLSFAKEMDEQDINIFNNLCEVLKIGVRVTDEVHLRFKSNLMMDLRFNTDIVIPVTATFGRTSNIANTVFQNHYPQSSRFGESIKNTHSEIQVYMYTLDPNWLPKNNFKTHKGYSQLLFEKFIMSKKYLITYMVNKIYMPIFRNIFFNIYEKDDKFLILFATTNLRDYITELLKSEYPSLKVTAYTDTSDISELETNDVIVSTPGKAGTGTDIANLRSMFVGISVNSDIANQQQLGRLRPLNNNKSPIFAYSVCYNIPSHRQHHVNRMHTFRPISKRITINRL